MGIRVNLINFIPASSGVDVGHSFKNKITNKSKQIVKNEQVKSLRKPKGIYYWNESYLLLFMKKKKLNYQIKMFHF